MKDAKYYYRLYSRSAKWRARKRAYMRKWYKANHQKILNYKRVETHGPGSVEHFAQRLKQQKNRCAICRKKMTKPNQDHKHGTKRLRGVLCNKCNTGLYFVEHPSWLNKAKKYLKEWHD